MKLNLLPTYVTKKSQAGVFVAMAALLLLVSIGAAAFLVLSARQQEQDAIAASDGPKANYAKAVAYAAAADQVILQATDADRHIKLARQMEKHNTSYISLYNKVLDYVPSFMRVRSITATPNGADGATVTLTSTLYSFQQYSDAVMALLRIPGVVNVVRSGYTLGDSYVPSINETDTIGSPIPRGQSNLPSDPQARMQELVARASAEPDEFAFQNVNNYGTPEIDRGPLPNANEVTFVVTLTGVALQVPDPRSTIMSGASGGGGGAAASPFGAPAGIPLGGPVGAPVGAGSAPAGAGAPAGGARGGGRVADDE